MTSRRIVTVVAVHPPDVGDGGAGAEAASRVRAALELHGGTVVTNHPVLVAAFASTHAAVDAAVALQRAATSPVAQAGVRVGISAGEVTVVADDWQGVALVEAVELGTAARSGQ